MKYSKTIVIGIALLVSGIAIEGYKANSEIPDISLISKALAKEPTKEKPSKKEPTKEELQAEVRNMAKETLAQLYRLQPGAKKAVQSSAGHAVFSNFGMKLGLVGSSMGEGIVVNGETKKETFMKMVELQAGWGYGVKNFKLVWVFQNQKDLSVFINSGWKAGGQTTTAAKMDDKGGAFAGAIQVSPGVWLYQMTEDGLALELTVTGAKYYKDDDLN